MVGLPVVGLPVVDLPVVDLPVVGLPVVGLPVVGLPVVDLPVADLPVAGLPVAGLGDLGWFMIINPPLWNSMEYGSPRLGFVSRVILPSCLPAIRSNAPTS